MSTPTAPATTAAPAAAAPVSAPAAAPVTPPSTPTSTPVTADKIGSTKQEGSGAHRLFQRLQENVAQARDEEDFPADKVEKKPEPTPAAEPPKAATPEKPIKVTKKSAASKRPEPPAATPPVAPVAQPVAPAADHPPQNWEDSLLEEERTALEDARFAEEQFPEYKGLSSKMEAFFKKHAKFLADNPDVDDNDPEYKKVLALKPELTTTDRRKIGTARTAAELKKTYEPELQDLRHELYVRDEEPKITRERNDLFAELADTSLPEEMQNFAKEKGVPELQKHYADEMEVAGSIIHAAADDAAELLRITRTNPKTKRPLVKIAESEGDPKYAQHKRLAELVDQVCEEFKNSGSEKDLVRDGKWFVTRDEWSKGYKNHPDKYWTFTNDERHVREMISRAKRWVPGAIKGAIEQRQKSLEGRGYKRVRDIPAAAVPASPVTPVSTPSTPRPSMAPSPGSVVQPSESRGSLLAKRLSGG